MRRYQINFFMKKNKKQKKKELHEYKTRGIGKICMN